MDVIELSSSSEDEEDKNKKKTQYIKIPEPNFEAEVHYRHEINKCRIQFFPIQQTITIHTLKKEVDKHSNQKKAIQEKKSRIFGVHLTYGIETILVIPKSHRFTIVNATSVTNKINVSNNIILKDIKSERILKIPIIPQQAINFCIYKSKEEKKISLTIENSNDIDLVCVHTFPWTEKNKKIKIISFSDLECVWIGYGTIVLVKKETKQIIINPTDFLLAANLLLQNIKLVPIKLLTSNEIEKFKLTINQTNISKNELWRFPELGKIDGTFVTSHSLSCLKKGEYLGDALIDFYMKYFQRYIIGCDCGYVYSTLFYTRLKKSSNTIKEAKSIVNWMSNPFSKQLLLFPIHYNLHWYLLVVSTRKGCWKKQPIFVVLNSLPGIRDPDDTEIIRKYLYVMWKESPSECPEHKRLHKTNPFSISMSDPKCRVKIKTQQFDIARQKNSYDCGIYLICFAEIVLFKCRQYLLRVCETKSSDMFCDEQMGIAVKHKRKIIQSQIRVFELDSLLMN
eukprot:c15991_g1_i2.p1 GENE.c15991_g1_i2~~c15991_g1_i2.p1  ORF type:complete len:509 (-),score=110.09 c15991_g1_i2:30-1556(-)